MDNSKGRKRLLTDEQTKEIINKYVMENGVSKEIRYVDIYNYSKELFFKNELSILPSESFWRKKDRAGRKVIDEVNKVISHKVNSHKNKNDFAHFIKLVDGKVTDQELKIVIIDELKSFKTKFDKFAKEIDEKDTLILELQNKNKGLDKLNKQQQHLISEMMYYFLQKSSETNREFYEAAFNKMFSDPYEYLEKFKSSEIKVQNNISQIFKNRLKQ